jgi:isocitrate dehydrogenase
MPVRFSAQAWAAGRRSRKRVSPPMGANDFFVMKSLMLLRVRWTARIEFVDASGGMETLKSGLILRRTRVLDATVMRKDALVAFLAEQMRSGQGGGYSLLAAPQSDHDESLRPPLFGHAVKVYFKRSSCKTWSGAGRGRHRLQSTV